MLTERGQKMTIRRGKEKLEREAGSEQPQQVSCPLLGLGVKNLTFPLLR